MIRVVGRERGTGGKGGEWKGMGKRKGGKGSGDSSSFGGPHPQGFPNLTKSYSGSIEGYRTRSTVKRWKLYDQPISRC